MADGKGCTCAAHSESECACAADWTPQEVYDLRAENERLREAIRRLAAQDATLSICNGNVTVTMDGTLTADERATLSRIAAFLAGFAEITPGNEGKIIVQQHVSALRALVARLGGAL